MVRENIIMKNGSLKILLSPNSFRGSLSAFEVADYLEMGFRKVFPDANIQQKPIADGGEMLLDIVIQSTGGRFVSVKVKDPLGKDITASYGFLPDGTTAVIELAKASGHNLLSKSALNPMTATTYGTGQLIKDALDKGAKKLIVGLGDSATVDAGTGMLMALGVKFYRKKNKNKEIGMGGGSLADIKRIDTSGMDERLKEAEIIVAADVSNPLLGVDGAARVFGPQKGATAEQVVLLDEGLQNFAKRVQQHFDVDISNIQYGGSSGGIAAAMYAFFGAELTQGSDLLLDLIGIDKCIEEADLLITAEGKLDKQTFAGKGPLCVAKRAKKQNKKVLFIGGEVPIYLPDKLQDYFDAVFSITNGPQSVDTAITNASELVEQTAYEIARLMKMSDDIMDHQ